MRNRSIVALAIATLLVSAGAAFYKVANSSSPGVGTYYLTTWKGQKLPACYNADCSILTPSGMYILYDNHRFTRILDLGGTKTGSNLTQYVHGTWEIQDTIITLKTANFRAIRMDTAYVKGYAELEEDYGETSCEVQSNQEYCVTNYRAAFTQSRTDWRVVGEDSQQQVEQRYTFDNYLVDGKLKVDAKTDFQKCGWRDRNREECKLGAELSKKPKQLSELDSLREEVKALRGDQEALSSQQRSDASRAYNTENFNRLERERRYGR